MLSSIFRLIQILFILSKYKIDKIIFKMPLLMLFRIFNPHYWCQTRPLDPPERLRICLQDLGPIFIKLGQAIAIRPDLIPAAYAKELSLLQDQVAPFSNSKMEIEKQYGHAIEKYFKTFDEIPLAAASIAQVHSATLHSGENVVIKIIRPGIKQKIRLDIRMMRFLAKILLWRLPHSRRLRPLAVIQELEHTLDEELDLIREGANASQLKRNFRTDLNIYVPQIYWHCSQKNILVMEKIKGIRISDHDTLLEAGFDLKPIAALGIEIFFKQVFSDNFFHADMHPGNIFINAEKIHSPQFILVDFGIMGTLSASDKRYLAQNFYAFIQKDYYRVAELHIESNWVPSSTRVDTLTNAVRAICEPILERPIEDISCAQLLMRLFNVGRQFNMTVQPQLLLLQKTLFAIEGLGRALDPQLDIWGTAKPHIESWIKKELGVHHLFQDIQKSLPYIRHTLIPQLVNKPSEYRPQQKNTLPPLFYFVIGQLSIILLLSLTNLFF